MTQPTLRSPASTGARERVDGFDVAVEALLYALLAFAPLAFGAVQAWSREVVLALVAVMAACVTVRLAVRRDAHFVWSWAYVPVGLFIGLAIVQTLPLPAAWVGRVSPRVLTLHGELVGDVPGAERLSERPTLSVYPFATVGDLHLVLAAAALFVVVLNTFRRTRQIKRALTAIALIGTAIAALALAQDFSSSTQIYWQVPMPPPARATGGPFINHSHFAQCMNLCLGAMIALLLVTMQEGFPGGDHPATLRDLWAERTSPGVRRMAWLAGSVIAGALAVALSLSRGGTIAMLASGAAVGVALLIVHGRRGSGARGPGSLLAALGLVAFACLLYFGFDAVYERFATRQDIEHLGGRAQILHDLALLWRQFPAVGTGLGTHAFVFPLVDRSVAGLTAAFAENEYAQLLEEMGVVGVTLLVAFVSIVFLAWLRCVRGARPVQAAGFGLGFGLLAVMVHSFSDFGQHMPANALFSATFCALLTTLGNTRLHGSRGPSPATANGPMREFSIPPAAGARGRWAGAALVTLLLVGLVAGLPGANAARVAAAHWSLAQSSVQRFDRAGWQAGNEQYADLIGEAWLAADAEPGNVVYRYRLNEFRWRALCRSRDEQTGRLVLTPEMEGYARGIVAELEQCRIMCPTFGSAVALQGQIEWLALDRPAAAAEHVRLGYRLSPQDASTCFVAGEFDTAAGNWPAAMEALQRAVAVDGNLLPDAVDLLAVRSKRPDLAFQVAANNPDALLKLASALEGNDVNAGMVRAARDRTLELLKARCADKTAPAGALIQLADLWAQRGNRGEAIACYYRALSSEFANADVHLRLARLLASDGQPAAAAREARACLRLQPGNGEAEKLIAALPIDDGSQEVRRK